MKKTVILPHSFYYCIRNGTRTVLITCTHNQKLPRKLKIYNVYIAPYSILCSVVYQAHVRVIWAFFLFVLVLRSCWLCETRLPDSAEFIADHIAFTHRIDTITYMKCARALIKDYNNNKVVKRKLSEAGEGESRAKRRRGEEGDDEEEEVDGNSEGENSNWADEFRPPPQEEEREVRGEESKRQEREEEERDKGDSFSPEVLRDEAEEGGGTSFSPSAGLCRATKLWFEGCRYTCDTCEFASTSFYDVRTHVLKEHGLRGRPLAQEAFLAGESSFRCLMCGETTRKDGPLVQVCIFFLLLLGKSLCSLKSVDASVITGRYPFSGAPPKFSLHVGGRLRGEVSRGCGAAAAGGAGRAVAAGFASDPGAQ